MPDRELFTGLDVYVDALNAINASQGWARRINDDVRKENIHGEFRFPSATSADVALAKKGSDYRQIGPITPEEPRTTGMPGYVMERSRYVGRVFLRSALTDLPVRV